VLLISSGIPDFHIVFAQNDLFLTEMAQARLTGKTEPLGETVTRNEMLCPA
jgi:hypothetical protein